MRLHSLRLQAFGPYVEQQFIDFDALARDGLYLFTGPTGAGKSTILDAVAFAFYGQLPGVRKGTSHRIKSDHAGLTARPMVSVECTLGENRVRITRSPSFVRPAKRGNGTTTERSSIAVEICTDGKWIGLEGGTRDNVVGDWIHQQVGLTCEQFMQVVLLPQGEFARFLLAADVEREAVLRTLFAADRFANVENWFDERERRLRTAAAEAAKEVGSRVAAACAIAGIDEADTPEPTDAAWFANLSHAAAAISHSALTSATECAAWRDTAQRRLTHSERIVAAQAKRATARDLATVAEQQIAKIVHIQARLADARKASVIAPLLHRSRVAQHAAEVAIARLAVSRASCAQATPASASTPQELLSVLQTERAALAPALDEELALAAVRHCTGEANAALAAAASELDLAIVDQGAMPGQLRIAADQVNRLRASAASYDQLAMQLSAIREIAAAHRDLKTLTATRKATLSKVLAATKSALLAKERWLDLREKRLAGIAAELASELIVDSPCAVCGSVRHPAPAIGDGSSPTRAEEEMAQNAADNCAHEQADATALLADLDIKISALQAKCGDANRHSTAQRVAEIEADLLVAANAAGDLKQAESVLAGLELRQITLGAEVIQLRAIRDDCSVRAAAEAERLRGAEHRIAAAAGKCASVTERIADLDGQVSSLADLVKATMATDDASSELAAAEAALRAAAIEANFASAQKAIEAHLPEADVEALQSEVDHHNQQSIEARTMLADPDFVGLPDEIPPIELLREHLAEADRADRAAAGALASAKRAAQQLATLHDQVLPAIDRAKARQAEHEVVRGLALLVRGQGGNELGMHLTAYFLAARLEQVADVASGHLLKMTDGRYSLIHNDQRAKKRGAGGLGLEVMDAHTGLPRPTHTLSGGEGFLAALALALGLAEVVTAESGATTLDTLFIDEGFGALDSEALERAMSVLDDLRSGGRSVGLISHVEELKTRITTQLQVTRTPHGSYLESTATTSTSAIESERKVPESLMAG
ncbi:MAG: SMC family ATPase [Antricoccus sp.]